MQNRGFIHQPYGHQQSRRGRRIYHPSPSRLAPAAPSQRGRLFIKGKKVKQYPPPNPNPSGTAKSNAHRRQSRRSCTRPDKHANANHRPCTQPKPKGTANPKSAPAAKPPQQHPAGNTHLREIKGLNDCVWQDNPTHANIRTPTTRTRQRRAAQAAQTAVGDAQLRILLRDDHVASTTSVRFQRTHKKRLFFGV